MKETEKIEFSDKELLEFMSSVTFNLGAVVMSMRDALGNYNNFPQMKERNEENIKEQLGKFEKALEKLNSAMEIIRDKTNYDGVEELLKLEINTIGTFSPIFEKIKQDPLKYAEGWRTGNESDLSSEFETMEILLDSFPSLDIFMRYSLLAKQGGGRKQRENNI